jgi:hypothetical protein
MARKQPAKPAAPPVRDPRLDRLWADPKSWKGGAFFGYYSRREDGRVVVPKRGRRIGWTVNMAHRLAIPMIVVFMLLAVGPPLLLAALFARGAQGGGGLAMLVGLGISFVLLFRLCRYLSNHEI